MSLAQLLDKDARNSIARLVYRVDAPKSIGRPRVASTTFVLDRVLYLCRTGCQWAHLPLPDFMSYKTIYHRFRIWAKHRVFEDAFYQRVCSYRMQHRTPLVVDTSFVKNQYGRDVLGRNPTDRARKATKVSMLADADGVPLAFHFHPANKHDSGTIGHLLDTASRKAGGNLQSHESLYADKGYDAQFGARPLHRALQKYLEDPLAEEILNLSVKAGDKLVADLDKENGKIKFIYQPNVEEPKISEA